MWAPEKSTYKESSFAFYPSILKMESHADATRKNRHRYHCHGGDESDNLIRATLPEIVSVLLE